MNVDGGNSAAEEFFAASYFFVIVFCFGVEEFRRTFKQILQLLMCVFGINLHLQVIQWSWKTLESSGVEKNWKNVLGN